MDSADLVKMEEGSKASSSLIEDVARDDLDAIRKKLSSESNWPSRYPDGTWGPLHEALALGKMHIAEELVTLGADIESRNVQGDSPLHMAITAMSRGYKSQDFLRRLLSSGAGVNVTNKRGESPLLLSAIKNIQDPSTFALLLSHGADVNLTDDLNRSPLYYSARNGRLDLCKQLTTNGALANIQAKCTLDTPLHMAVADGNPEIVKLLLQTDATMVSVCNSSGHNMLHQAAKSGRLQVLQILHEQYPELSDSTGHNGESLLHLASQHGHTDVSKALLKWGSFVDPKDCLANTPLHLAAMNNHLKMAKMLVKHGASVLARNAAGKSPFDIATEEGHHVMCKWLSDPTGIRNRRTPRRNFSANFHKAVREENLQQILISLRDGGVDINLQDYNGNTALHVAAELGSHGLVAFLLKRNADPLVSNDLGNVPMHVATLNGHLDVARLLAGHQRSYMQINFHNDEGLTPLHFAVLQMANTHTSTGVLRVLLESDGVMPNSRTWKGMTAMDMAESRHCQEAVDLITAHCSELDLFKALYCHMEDEFVRMVSDIQDVNVDNGCYTLLQLSSVLGMDGCVESLIRRGADLNAVCELCPVPPVLLAAAWGHFRVLEVFLRWKSVWFHVTTHDSQNILHILAQGLGNRVKSRYSPFYQVSLNSAGTQDYDLCIQKVLVKLTKRGSYPFYINDKDKDKNTPLHYAVQHRSTSTVVQMLMYGADPWACSEGKLRPIDRMNVRTLTEYLDCCVLKNQVRQGRIQSATIMYDILRPSNNSSEWKRLKHLKSCKKKILKHPVLDTFLYFKWKHTSIFLYLNILLYSLFLLSSNYILTMNFKMMDSLLIPPHIAQGIYNNIMIPLCYATLVLLLAREFIQAISAFRVYVKSWESYLELSLLLFMIVLPENAEFTLLFIFLSWVEFVAMIGRFPMLAKYTAMFSAVVKNYISFLLVFTPLLIGFMITLHLAVEICENEICNSIFPNPLTMSLKLAVMMLGELEFRDISFDETSMVVARLLYLLFLFMVVLVLMNLLHALAVSDTQAIYSQAELYSQLSTVKFVCYVESFFYGQANCKSGKLSRFLHYFRCSRLSKLIFKCPLCRLYICIWQKLRDRVTVFPKLPKGQLAIDLKNGVILNRKGWKLPMSKVRPLRDLLEKREERTSSRIKQYEQVRSPEFSRGISV